MLVFVLVCAIFAVHALALRLVLAIAVTLSLVLAFGPDLVLSLVLVQARPFIQKVSQGLRYTTNLA